jgi:hypothetical protein
MIVRGLRKCPERKNFASSSRLTSLSPFLLLPGRFSPLPLSRPQQQHRRWSSGVTPHGPLHLRNPFCPWTSCHRLVWSTISHGTVRVITLLQSVSIPSKPFGAHAEHSHSQWRRAGGSMDPPSFAPTFPSPVQENQRFSPASFVPSLQAPLLCCRPYNPFHLLISYELMMITDATLRSDLQLGRAENLEDAYTRHTVDFIHGCSPFWRPFNRRGL